MIANINSVALDLSYSLIGSLKGRKNLIPRFEVVKQFYKQLKRKKKSSL